MGVMNLVLEIEVFPRYLVDFISLPGTSACPNGHFYCANVGHNPVVLPSAFVSDGICDCCDGSDEPEGVCTPHCMDAAVEHRARLLVEYDEELKGIAVFIWLLLRRSH